MPLEIRLINESEYTAVNDFYNMTSHIGRPAPLIIRSYDKFCWEFINCPVGTSIYAGAYEHKEGNKPVLVGTQCVVLLKMIDAKGNAIMTAKGEATLIDIKALTRYKKKDILKELFSILIEECGKRGIEFLWGFNTIPATYKRLGFDNPFKSYHGLLVLKPVKAYKNIVSLKINTTPMDKFKIAAGAGLSYLYSIKKSFILSRKNKYRLNFELNENEILFRNASSPDKLIFLLQDKNCFDWRISANPYHISYKSYQLMDENNMLSAQVICSIQKDVAFIEQTLFDSKLNKKNRQLFLKRILTLLENENISVVRFTGFTNNRLNQAEMNLVKSIGFLFTGKGEWFTFKNLSADSIINPENIYLSRMYKQGVN